MSAKNLGGMRWGPGGGGQAAVEVGGGHAGPLRKFRTHQKNDLSRLFFLYADADSGLQIIPKPGKNVIFDQL